MFETWSEDGINYMEIVIIELVKNVSAGTLTIRLYYNLKKVFNK